MDTPSCEAQRIVSRITSVGRSAFRGITLGLALVLLSGSLSAQQRDSTSKPSPDSARVAAPPAAPRIDFSGVLFANYQYRRDRGSAHGANKFDVERAYLTFRMPAGERASVRITTDLFQQQSSGSDAYYKGWTLRAKYAYLQYDYLKRGGFTG